MKERVTLTLDKGILARIDQRIDGTTIKNRSHGVETLLRQVLGGNVRTAILLAGGKQEKNPAALQLVHGKPILEHNIALLRKYGVTDIFIALSKGNEQIRDYFGTGQQYGIRIRYLEEPEPLGTAGCLRLAQPFLTESFIVGNGDDLKQVPVDTMLAFHHEHKSMTSIALTTVQNPAHYGMVLLDGARITGFFEKPSINRLPSSFLINSGFYILEPEVLRMIPRGYASLEKDIFPRLVKEGKLFGYSFVGQWFSLKSTPIAEIERQWKDIG